MALHEESLNASGVCCPVSSATAQKMKTIVVLIIRDKLYGIVVVLDRLSILFFRRDDASETFVS